MAQPTGTFSTYQARGIREDLSDMIYNISPTETPFFSGCKKGSADNTFTEWQIDSLAATNVNNATIEGDDATLQTSAPTTRAGNYCQISTKTAVVTGTQEAVKKAGRTKEMAFQIAKRTKEMKRDMETILLANQAYAVGSDTVARRLGSVLSYIRTNSDNGVGGANPAGAIQGATTRTDGTTRAFTETQLKNVLQQCWVQGGNPSVIMVSGSNKQVASTFTGGATRFDDSQDRKVYAAVDVYASDFGDLKIIPNRFQRARDALILDMDYWEVAFLRNTQTFPLAKTGDTEKNQILAEYTLRSKQEAASGIVADLT